MWRTSSPVVGQSWLECRLPKLCSLLCFQSKEVNLAFSFSEQIALLGLVSYLANPCNCQRDSWPEKIDRCSVESVTAARQIAGAPLRANTYRNLSHREYRINIYLCYKEDSFLCSSKRGGQRSRWLYGGESFRTHL